MSIGDAIKLYRQQHNMSQQTFAEKASLTQAFVSMLESSKRSDPSISYVAKIADAIGISIDKLVSFEAARDEITKFEQLNGKTIKYCQQMQSEEKYLFTIELCPFQRDEATHDEAFWALHLEAMKEEFPGVDENERLELLVEEMKSQCASFIDRELEAYKSEKTNRQNQKRHETLLGTTGD